MTSRPHLPETSPRSDSRLPALRESERDDVGPPAIPGSVTTEDLLVEGPHGTIPLRVYTPATRPAATLLWMHGGGFSRGTLDWPEAHMVSAELAARASARVVSVDYRLAGAGILFPVPLDDVYAAWEWLTSAFPRSEGGIHAVGGASAGAALALGCAVRGRDESLPADRVLLAYPFAHYPNPALDSATVRAMEAIPGILRFSPASIEEMVTGYVGRITDLPPLALPGAARLDGLPPTAIALSEYDDLRPSGELLGRQLTSVGVPVSLHVAARMPHGHLNHWPSPPEASASLDFLGASLSSLPAGRATFA
ncbi:alpha/beta hydrolase fold domain-containing protein [Streptomyces atroolivaceus]|uniref:alpha/beta hydrolase fold domain-containing protein n=1 Tax=Streptomyces atroolivaceus TaxID=66869 RepID=UPI0037932C4E